MNWNIYQIWKKRFTKNVITTFLILIICNFTYAQVAINEDNSDPDATAILDVKSTSKGVLIPNLSLTERNTVPSPAEGLMIFNRTVGFMEYYNDTSWIRIPRVSVLDPAINGSGSENEAGVGVGIEDPDNSAILHINSNTKGFLPPRMAALPVSAIEGAFFYNSSTKLMTFYDGTSWNQLTGTSLDTSGAGGAGTAEGVIIGDNTVDGSAKLEIEATDKSFIFPRMTTVQRDAIESPAEGLLVYNIDNQQIEYFTADIWYTFSSSALLGYSSGNPGTTCEDILATVPGSPDGNYWIDPDGAGGEAAFECNCDMTTDGGGWIKLQLDRTDQIFVYSNNVATNNVYKCGDDGSGLEIDNYNHLSSNPTSDDAGGANPSTINYTLNYINPATTIQFTAGQLTAIRGQITTLSAATDMVALTCDDDNNNPGFEIIVYAEDATTIDLAVGESSNDTWGAWFWNTSGSGVTAGVTGTNDITTWPTLPTKYIIPAQLDLVSNTGGGMMWGYEEDHLLVK